MPGDLDLSGRDDGLYMKGQRHVHALQNALLNHKACAALAIVSGGADGFFHRSGNAFLRGLKEEFDFAPEGVSMGGEELGGAQQHGHMGIMAAGVHFSGIFGAVVAGGHFLHLQAVHIRPNQQRFAGAAGIQCSHHAGDGDAGLHLHAAGAEVIGDDAGGPVLVIADLRVAV